MLSIVRTLPEALEWAKSTKELHGGDMSGAINSEKALIILYDALMQQQAGQKEPSRRRSAPQAGETPAEG